MNRYIKNKRKLIKLMKINKDTPSYINYITQEGSGSKKWNMLHHNGVLFYPEYKSHNIPIVYDNETIMLNYEAEEYISYYVQSRFDKYKTKKFNRNFFKDWAKLLTPELRKKIIDFDKCSFDNIKNYITEEALKKKTQRENMSKDEKEKEKKQKKEFSDIYKIAIVDENKQLIDNFIVEPPTIYTGRGDHPLSGSIKKRLYPKDITLNISDNIPVPKYIDGTLMDTTLDKNKWGNIISDKKLEWIASWQNNVTKKFNYARFGRKSSFKMKSDENKYEIAKKLKKKIKKIREQNHKNMLSSNKQLKQLATALWLIDRLSLRVGNEKTKDESDTVGVSTLTIQHIQLIKTEKYFLKLTFLGKDSIEYNNKIEIEELVYNNFMEFYMNKNKNDQLFDLINSNMLNKYIKSFLKKATSKTFRSSNASTLMQSLLYKITNKYKDHIPYNKTILEKVKHEYDMALLEVAKMCNHRREAKPINIDQIQTKLNELKQTKNKLEKLKQTSKSNVLNKKLNTVKANIQKIKNKIKLKSESMAFTGTTAITNYIDARIIIAFLKKNKLMDNIDMFLSKALQENFKWAMSVSEDYKF
jgi:DNA topoisomerase-1